MARPFQASTWLARIVGAILILAALRTGHELLVPLALAVLLALLLAPIGNALERLHLCRSASVLTTVLLAAILMAGMGWLVTRQVAEVARKLPDYRGNIEAKTARMGPVGGLLLKGYRRLESTGTELSRKDLSSPPPFRSSEMPPDLVSSGSMDLLGEFFLSLFNNLGTGFIVLLLVVFLLIYRDDLRDRLIQLFGVGQVQVTTQAMSDAAGSVSRYLLTQAIVNVSYGILVMVGLIAIGIPNALLWGVLAGLWRFIPYFGIWLGAALPIFLSVAVFPGWTRSLVLAGSWLALEIIVANAVEPQLYGKKAGLSPLAVLVAAVFWTWAWGGLGLLLAIPITVSLVVLGKHFSGLGFLHTLLSADASLEPRIQLYQRLLASDHPAAEELVEQFAQGKTLSQVCDFLLLPALSLAQEDRAWGRLEDSSIEFIRKTLLAIAEDLADRPQSEIPPTPPVVPANAAPHLVLSIPAADAADEVGSRMIQRILESRGVHAEVLALGDTVGEKARQARERGPDLVILVSLQPSALIPVRYLYKKIRTLLPDTEVLVSLLQAQGDARKWSERISSRTGPPAAISVQTTESAVAQMLPPVILAKAAATPVAR
ncbi:MAG TPA: AI-2E family transporter [Planctomycetota bacterium]|nr:AI-2E family transporter [Planctomycetota bacterium]